MKYLGSKARIAKYILPVMLKGNEGKTWVEPFVGGCNVIDKVQGVKRIGADNNPYLIALLKKLQTGWLPPTEISREQANYIRQHKDEFPDWYVGWIGYGRCGFGGKFFGGYCKLYIDNGTPRDAVKEAYRNMTKQAKKLTDVDFVCCDYRKLSIPKEAVVYCDPPYKGYTGFNTGKFDHDEFWQWVREISTNKRAVFVSEYNAPDDFECLWQRPLESIVNNHKAKHGIKRLEKLFRWKG